MENIVFLGVFDKVANWIMSGISKVLTWLVSNIIAPVCSFIWENAFKYLVEEITEWISILVYQLYALILSILYALETAVYSFAGVRNVYYNGKEDSILALVFGQEMVKHAFWYITGISVVLLFIFTVVTVIKTNLDFGYDGKKSIGTILTSFWSSALMFLVLPVLCYGLVQLTSVCMNSMYSATAQSGTASVTDNVFMLSVSGSVREKKNSDDKDAFTKENYQELVAKMQSTPMLWRNLTNVKPYIHRASNVDFVIGVLGAVILAVNLIIISGLFIQRVMEIVVLYIVSPFFVSTIPLDDGERFGKWRRTFIGRLCMGGSIVIALNVVLMLISVFLSGSEGYTIRFTEDVALTDNTLQSVANDSIDIILKLIFMIGCIISVKNIGSIVTGIIDEQAAAVEKESIQQGTRRLVEAPEKIAALVGGVQGLAKGMGSMGQSKMAKGSAQRGFSGQTANANEMNFFDSVQKMNKLNSAKATFTKRGAKFSALNEKTEKGNSVLSQFKQLKTHEERAAFMQDFQRKGGINSLKVDGSKFGKSEMTSVKERSMLSNLESRIDAAVANRDKFEKGSSGYNKYNKQVNELTGMKKSFDSLNTHSEREAFMNSHKEFGNRDMRSVDDMVTSSRLQRQADGAKAERDGFTKGSVAWKKADERYQSALNDQAEFDSLSTREERDGFKTSNAGKISGKNKALSNLNRRIDQTEKARNSFEEGSEGWKSFDKKLNNLNSLSIGYNNLTSDEEREAFATENESAFGDVEKMDSSSSKNLSNIDKKIASVTKARNRFSKGSAKWSEYNNQLDGLKTQRAEFATLSTNEQRNDFVSGKSEFKSAENKNEQSALNILDAKKLTAITNRDMFEQGSENWNFYNEKAQGYDIAAAELMSKESSEDKTSFIAENPIFNKSESLSYGNDKQRKKLTSNLNRAVQARDRHKVGSAKWQQCNKEVISRKSALADYDSLETRQDRDLFEQDHPQAFDTGIENDEGYNKIESAYKSWAALEQYASTQGQREHAHKMAKSYADFSERYMAASPEEKSNILSQADSFGAKSATATGIGFSLKETEELDLIKATGNEKAVSRFVNSKSHKERAEIISDIADGKYDRFEIPTEEETAYQTQLDASALNYKTLAESTDDSEQKKSYEAMANYCSRASEQYSDLTTHNQRANCAKNIAAKMSANGGKAPVMKPSPLNQRETEFASGLSGDAKTQFTGLVTHRDRCNYMAEHFENPLPMSDEEQQFFTDYLNSADSEYERTARYKLDYVSAPTHEARDQIMYEYSNYITYADETEQPENWNSTPDIPFEVSVASTSESNGSVPAQDQSSAPAQEPVQNQNSNVNLDTAKRAEIASRLKNERGNRRNPAPGRVRRRGTRGRLSDHINKTGGNKK